MSSLLILSNSYGLLIDRTLRIIKLRYLQTFRANGIDITPEQWALLDQLCQTNGISQNELANETFKNAPTVSRIIDLLCKKGWTERSRHENDGRSFNIFLTSEGEKIVKKLLPKVAHLRELGSQNISEKDYKVFIGLLNKIYENYQEEIIG
jgi:Transcriptional regulators